LAEKEREMDLVAHEIAQARRGLDQARDAVQATTARVHQADRDCHALEARRRETAVSAERLAEELESIADTVARPLDVLPGWRDALDGDAAALIERCASRVARWADNTARRDSSRETLAELDRVLAEARSDARSTRAAADDAERLQAAADRALADLQTTRGTYFDGKPVDRVEQVLDAACETAEAREKSASQALSESQRKASAADQAVVAIAAEVERRQIERAGAERRLDAALDEAGVDVVQLEQWLQRDTQWVADERTTIEGLRAARETAVTVLGERTKRRQAHEARVPALTRADADVQLQSLSARLDDQRNQLAERIGRLRQDDERRQQAAALAQEADRQARKAMTWSALNDLIGSADGKKFRVFAQSLTLQALLAHANSHLEDLSRRYRLQRVPGSDLELQVIDADMGDEVRSVHSLSGGESFLVSLALALGLASLSSRTAQVESLFIDEGFGSLDQDALDSAIASLDTLQSLGRKVGVISHVPTLVERIGTRICVVPRGGGRSVVEVRRD
jgi:exonuclease SbcC